MKTTLYDLFDDQDRFLMRAPIAVIAAVLKLHQSAVKRIEAETEQNSICSLHMNGKHHPFTSERFIVQSAVGSRGETADIPARVTLEA